MSGNELSSVHLAPRVRRLTSPLSLSAYLAWIAITIGAVDFPKLAQGVPAQWTGLLALVAMLALFVLRAVRDPPSGQREAVVACVLQGALVVVAEFFLRAGETSVLLVVVAGQLVLLASVRATLLWLLVFNLAFALLWAERAQSLTDVLLWLLPVAAFQGFAALTAYYAGTSELDRERLAQVNAELLATRHLLEETARSGERLKLSRELHDVAGHKLTALKLNLALLARDPEFAGREELGVVGQLADELLDDIRGVVGELRAHDGLDLRGALEALARPLPGARLTLDIDPELKVGELGHAEVLLRCAQEAITNALRHGRATHIRLRCGHHAGWTELCVENSGKRPAVLVPGNGLTGMRERVEALGGILALDPLSGGLRVTARLPAKPA